MGKQRILFIDLLKFVAILFVTWGHTMGQLGTRTQIASMEIGWIFTFHMPLFAILSGLFFIFSEDMGLMPMLKKKIQGLLIPNAVWCFLFYVLMHGVFMIGQILLGEQDIYQGNLLEDWWHAMWYEGWWFLRALFFAYVYAICSVWLFREIGITRNLMLIVGLGSNVLLYTCSLLGVIPNHHPVLIGAIYLYPFVWTGVAIKALDGYITKYLMPIFATSIVVWLIGLYYWEDSYTFYSMNTSIFATEGSIVGLDVLWVSLFRFVIGVAASLTVITLIRMFFGKTLQGNSKVLDYLVDIGKYTLFIYVAPTFIFHAVKQRVLCEGEITSLFVCTLITFIIIICCYLLAKQLDRWIWTRRLLLGVWK